MASKASQRIKTTPKQIDVLSWSWGKNRSGSAHVGGGPSVGKVNVQDVQITNSRWHRRTRAKNDFFELPRMEYSGFEGFAEGLAVNCPAPAKAPLPRLDDHEAEEINLQIGGAQTGFRTGALASPAGQVSGAWGSPFTTMELKSYRTLISLSIAYNLVADGGSRK